VKDDSNWLTLPVMQNTNPSNKDMVENFFLLCSSCFSKAEKWRENCNEAINSKNQFVSLSWHVSSKFVIKNTKIR